MSNKDSFANEVRILHEYAHDHNISIKVVNVIRWNRGQPKFIAEKQKVEILKSKILKFDISSILKSFNYVNIRG